MEGDGIDPKDLEILPVRLVQAALQKGLTAQSGMKYGELLPSNSKNAAKYALKNRRFGKEAVSMLNRAASLFVLYIASIAQDQAKSKKRSTIYDKDVLEALKLGLFWEIEREMSSEMQKVYSEMGGEKQLEGEEATLKNAGEEFNDDDLAMSDDVIDVDDDEELDEAAWMEDEDYDPAEDSDVIDVDEDVYEDDVGYEGETQVENAGMSVDEPSMGAVHVEEGGQVADEQQETQYS
ncbi:hypothetical protein BgAZ_301840 [Babesia gibsoni]|uniref:Transcription factor CBF/NF-Y/archaeal histone domain-containing protein n=1 Tax=Babesia gibsoni TaxID=33632 RepID=A0AAD8PDU8_BABGI|nr:hypothetical protein BgAZ_301840 [Babesia gibsoni]